MPSGFGTFLFWERMILWLGCCPIVICFEEIAGQYLIATNIFVREGNDWKIVHHQAGPTAGQPDEGESDAGDSVH